MNWFSDNWLGLIIVTFILTLMWVSYRETVRHNRKIERDVKSGKYKLPDSDAAVQMRKHGWK